MQSEICRPHWPARLWLLVVLQGRCFEAAMHLLRLLKPNAINRFVVHHAADGFDGHNRPARAKLDNVTGLEGLLSHDVSPAGDPHKRESLGGRNFTLLASASGFKDEREPPLRLGDIVQLNSGSPRMMVVDTVD